MTDSKSLHVVPPVDGADAPPHNIEAEQALLGAMMYNNKAYDDLGGAIQAVHFYVPFHGEVFEAMEMLINRGREASPITLRQVLKSATFDTEADLLKHLTEMLENANYVEDMKTLAEVVHTTYVQRQLLALGQNVSHNAARAHTMPDTQEVVEEASSELFALGETGASSNTVRNLRGPLQEVIQRAEEARKNDSKITGVATQFTDLDALTGGMQKSDLIILAARPSMGKTAITVNMAYNAARAYAKGADNGAGVGIFSMEMGADQLAARLLSSAASINSQHLSTGQMSDADFGRLVAVSGELADLPIYIDDTPALSVNAVRSRARRMKRQYGIGMLVIDYLQLMQGSSAAAKNNRVQEISEISQGLKTIARELNIPVIACSQLSRAVENRDNKRPQLSDLRESGSIEQDADIVMFLYREEYYLEKQLGMGAEEGGDEKLQQMSERLESVRGKTEVLVSKNRKGATGTIALQFQGETTTFHNYTSQEYK